MIKCVRNRSGAAAILGILCCCGMSHGQWVERAFPGGGAAAYDSARGVVVFVHGSTDLISTWEWDGSRWTKRSGSGPSPRTSPGLAFDSWRGVTVCFGGLLPDGTYTGDTWEWDGVAWSLRAVGGPSPRSHPAMTFDANRGRTVLVGGFGNDGFTWEWDGIEWTQSNATGAPLVSAGSMTFDAHRNVSVLYDSGNRIHEYDGTTWALRWNSSSGPGVRLNARITYDPMRQTTLLFGGWGSGSDTWGWDGSAWTQLAWDGPLRRGDHAMVFDEARGEALVIGGQSRQCVFSPSGGTEARLSDTHAWSGQFWAQRGSPGSWWVRGHDLVYDAARQETVLYSGMFGTVQFGPCQTGQTWTWNGTDWTNQGQSGPARGYGYAMAYDSLRERVVYFSGEPGGSPEIGHTWEWNGSSWTQRWQANPPGRTSAAMAFDIARGEMVLFGGLIGDGGTGASDTWTWDGQSWELAPVIGASGRYRHAMAYDANRERVVLFGGYNGSTSSYSDETWEWDGSHWLLRQVSGPSARAGHRMAFDTNRGRVVLYGGSGPGFNGGHWEWDGQQWTHGGFEEAGRRTEFGLAYDSNRGVAVLFGGRQGSTNFTGDTWEYGYECPGPEITAHPQPQTAPDGSTVSFTITCPTGGTAFQWTRNGFPLSNGGGYSGVNTQSLSISPVMAQQAGWYACTATNSCGTVASRAARLEIGCYANCDNSTGSPVLNVADFTCFLQRFAAADPYANCDGSSQEPTLNVADFTCFLQRFAIGCP